MKKLLLFILPILFVSCSDSDNKNNGDDNGDQGGLVARENAFLDALLQESFSSIIDVRKGSKTYEYLCDLTEEAMSQLEGKSKFGLPLLYQEKNFPTVYNYYTENQSDKNSVNKTMVGWLCAMQLSELCPSKRNKLYKAGYEAGGFNMDSPIYGYHFCSDPNVARLVASGVYAAMRGTSEPDIEAMRLEVGGSTYGFTLEGMYVIESLYNVFDDGYYVDLRYFMASAPGPYSPLYADREGINPTFPDEKAPNGCLKVDMDIYNSIVEEINLPNQRAVQAIADGDIDVHHLFGTDKHGVGGMYDFNAVFGESTIGQTIDPEGITAVFVSLMQKTGSSARGILQHANSFYGHYEYGRLRPGCSEQQQEKRKSYTDDRLNVLTNFVIEDNDGHKLTYNDDGIEKYYYDEDGNWTNENVQSPEQYEDMVKDQLFPSSYPSGHSSGIWSAAMTLMEIYPQKADLIMKAANDFAVSRTVSRYHWNSDIIQGRVIGSVMNPVCHATKDYDVLLDAARKDK